MECSSLMASVEQSSLIQHSAIWLAVSPALSISSTSHASRSTSLIDQCLQSISSSTTMVFTVLVNVAIAADAKISNQNYEKLGYPNKAKH